MIVALEHSTCLFIAGRGRSAINVKNPLKALMVRTLNVYVGIYLVKLYRPSLDANHFGSSPRFRKGVVWRSWD